MADNVNITAGTGTVIATDQVGTDHYQKVKFYDGTADSSNASVIDSSNRLYVRNRPSTLRTRIISSGLTTATTAYTIGDVAGAIMSIAGAATSTGGTGVLQSITFVDKGDVGVDYRLHFFRSSISVTDNSPFAPSDADMQDWCGEVVMPSLRDLGANRAAYIGNIGMGYDTGAGTTLYCVVETRTANAVYAAATDINITPYLVLD